MTDFDKELIAELIGVMLSESHGIETRHQGDKVALVGLSLIVVVDEPVIHHDGAFLEVPIGVGDPSWLAWDRSLGVSRQDTHPIDEAVTHWVHFVLPLFIALREPTHPMTGNLYRKVMPDAGGASVDILAAPVLTRRFEGPTEQFDNAIGQNPPTLVVAEWLVEGSEIPAGRPMWLHTMCGRVGDSDTTQVVLNNELVTEHFPGFADDVDWFGGSGTAKSWAVLHRLPE